MLLTFSLSQNQRPEVRNFPIRKKNCDRFSQRERQIQQKLTISCCNTAAQTQCQKKSVMVNLNKAIYVKRIQLWTEGKPKTAVRQAIVFHPDRHLQKKCSATLFAN